MLIKPLSTLPLPSSNPSIAGAGTSSTASLSLFDVFLLIGQNGREFFDIAAAAAAAAAAVVENTATDAEAVAATASVRIPAASASAASSHCPGGVDLARPLTAAATRMSSFSVRR